jgi:hypothetical protein
MKTTIEIAKKQQKLLLLEVPDFHPPRRLRVSARYSTSPTLESDHQGIENSTKFNNGYGKLRLMIVPLRSTVYHSAKTVSFCNIFGLECKPGTVIPALAGFRKTQHRIVEKRKTGVFRQPLITN